MAALVDPAIDNLRNILMPGRNRVKPGLQLRAAIDVLNRNGIRNTNEVMMPPPLSPLSLSRLTDDELKTLLTLARKASTL